MRISERNAKRIKAEAEALFGPTVSVYLFGSRVRDDLRGGDVDILVDSDEAVEQPAQLSALLSVRISRLLNNRKVDVLVHAPNLADQPIHRIALESGARL